MILSGGTVHLSGSGTFTVRRLTALVNLSVDALMTSPNPQFHISVSKTDRKNF